MATAALLGGAVPHEYMNHDPALHQAEHRSFDYQRAGNSGAQLPPMFVAPVRHPQLRSMGETLGAPQIEDSVQFRQEVANLADFLRSTNQQLAVVVPISREQLENMMGDATTMQQDVAQTAAEDYELDDDVVEPSSSFIAPDSQHYSVEDYWTVTQPSGKMQLPASNGTNLLHHMTVPCTHVRHGLGRHCGPVNGHGLTLIWDSFDRAAHSFLENVKSLFPTTVVSDEAPQPEYSGDSEAHSYSYVTTADGEEVFQETQTSCHDGRCLAHKRQVTPQPHRGKDEPVVAAPFREDRRHHEKPIEESIAGSRYFEA